MLYRYICINPFKDTVEKECNRYPHDVCCMCRGPMIVINLDSIDELIQTLKMDGINSKEKAINLLEKMKVNDNDEN